MPSTDGGPQRTARRVPPPPPVTRADLEPIADTVQRTANELAAHDAAVESRIQGIERNVNHMTEMVDELARAVRDAVRAAPVSRPRARTTTTRQRETTRRRAQEVKPETLAEAMIAAIGRSRASFTAQQILDKLEARQGHRPGGATPEATVSAKLATENAKGGLFERTAPGKYRVRR